MIEYFPPVDNAKDYIRRGDLLFKSTFRDGIFDNSESTLQRLDHYYVSLRQVYEAPAADVVEVVRCKDCEYWRPDGENVMVCTGPMAYCDTDEAWYCAAGKLKNGGQDE